jgi:nuclear migration protein JNM1
MHLQRVSQVDLTRLRYKQTPAPQHASSFRHTMAEAQKPKYDSLPGIDTAPDVYETPELAEDVSTIPASTAASDSGDGSDAEVSGVQHQRLQTDQARSRFQPSRVDAHGVDFSDNITAQRRSYRTSTRAQRRRGEVLGDDSDEEKESFSRKLMRVKKELQELEAEYKKGIETGDKSKIEEHDPWQVMAFISDKVDQIYTARRGGVRGAEPQLDRTIDKFNNYAPFGPSPRLTKAIANQPPLPGSQVQRGQLEHVLKQAADFDSRLTQLENSMGLNGNTMPDLGDKAPFPVFTTLERIEQTIGLVGDATQGNLEAASTNIKKLIADAEQLKQKQQDASRDPENPSSPPQNPEQEAKVNALYGTLPSIEKLTPMLPLVLERLRTLRLVHTSAWQADEVLTELENRQSLQEAEIKKWDKALQDLEVDVKKCEKAQTSNMKVVGDWVKRIEEQVAKLPSGAVTDVPEE